MPKTSLNTAQSQNSFSVLPLRDVVVFPNMVIPLFVGRENSIVALDIAMNSGKEILLVSQKTADIDEPSVDDLYEIGTLSKILQLLKLPDGTVKVLVEGSKRIKVLNLKFEECFKADYEILTDDEYDNREIDVLSRALVSQFEQYLKLNKKIPPEVLTSISGIDDACKLSDTITAHIPLKLKEKQKILEIHNVKQRLEHLLEVIQGEIDVLQVEKQVRIRVKSQMEKSQREYYLNEQMKAIQSELGDIENTSNDLGDLESKINESGMTEEASDKALAELNKLKLMSPMSAEATVVRNYLDCLVKVPWKKKSKIFRDIGKAENILHEDHYGLDKVKERILEYLAVQQRVKKLKGPILCLVGPPGVGKTSLGKSIARATNRNFIRMSLGGVRDEAEIRGHRRTYIGSMPGKIIQNLSKVKSLDSVIMFCPNESAISSLGAASRKMMDYAIGKKITLVGPAMLYFTLKTVEYFWKAEKQSKNVDKVIEIDQSPIGRTPRSNPATYTGMFTFIRELFAMLPESRARGFKPGRFSFNVKGGRCESCQGDGVIAIEMHFLPDVYVTCEECKGRRYNRETLDIKYRGKSIAEVLDLTVDQALPLLENFPPIAKKLRTLQDVGLGYVELGQSATTLSGGEAQRVKLAKELSRRDTGSTVYILDEPTTGLHFEDIRKLLDVLNKLVDQGNTIVVIEHNFDIIRSADYLIDLGPEGGDAGGEVVATGTPEEVAMHPKSITGHFLKPLLQVSTSL